MALIIDEEREREVSSDTRKNEIQRCWNKSTSGGRNRRAMKSCYAGLLEDSSPRLRMTVGVENNPQVGALYPAKTILPSPTAPPSFTQGRLESDGRGVPRRVSSDTGKNEIQRCWNKSTYGGRNRRAMKSCYAGLLEDSSPRLRMTVKGR